MNRDFFRFTFNAAVIPLVLAGLVVAVNCSVDSSYTIRGNQFYSQMARLALAGNIVAVPMNYNERLYQVAVVSEMKDIPETLVAGSSRGMFLGEEVTGYHNLYNACVSGACLEDYYALIGMYYQKFGLPKRIIIETSPWVVYAGDKEARWRRTSIYAPSAMSFYFTANGHELKAGPPSESPYFSISYFQYNFGVLIKNGTKAFSRDEARVSTNPSEAADYPDGSIRYAAKLENPSPSRLAEVTSQTGPVTYKNLDKMTGIDALKAQGYENLIKFLMASGVEVMIYLQPFSPTQCRYIYEGNANPAFRDVEAYLHELGGKFGIKIYGGYDARKFGLGDERFIDFMHLDKAGTKILWGIFNNR